MDNNKRIALLEKFANRTLTPTELEEFWIMIKSGSHQELLEEDIDLLPLPVSTMPSEMAESLSNLKISLSSQIAKRKSPLKLVYKITAAVAAILILIGGFKGYQYFSYLQDTKTLITVNVAVGKMQKLILADSSVVTVSSGSTFSYPKAFTKTERRVYLKKGKAFFEVKKDPEKPFSVESGDLQTTALGTSFTVQYNDIYRWEKVSLYTGKVVIKPKDGTTKQIPVFLTPGKAYEYSDGQGNMSRFDLLVNDPIGKPELLFEHASLNETLFRISSYYRIKIDFNPKTTHSLTVNGDFSDQNVEETLKTLAFIHQLKFKKTDSLNYRLMKK